MEITIAEQKILLFTDKLSSKEAEQKAWDKKLSAFDTLSKFGGLLSNPKDEDFELIYKEHRYQPFWHVNSKARYVYDRNSTYQVSATGTEVKTVTLMNSDFEITNGHFHLPVLEHCVQEEEDDVFIDAVTGKTVSDLKKYLSFSLTEISDETQNVISKESILIPPQIRISGIMRASLSKMIKGIQADKIIEEKIEVKCVDLYYRPVYAYQYKWISKNKDAIIEVDALTGETGTGVQLFKEYLGHMLDKKFLMDIGADIAGMIIPGGNIAVKLAQKYIEKGNQGK